jgi:thiamine-phosphate diphosphorylase
MNLPRLMAVTAHSRMRLGLGPAVGAALQGGVRLVQLRECEHGFGAMAGMARTAAALCTPWQAQLLLNCGEDLDATLALALSLRGTPAVGLHLPARMVNETGHQSALAALQSSRLLWGASVHNAAQAQRAAAAGAGYLVFGAIYDTASHPGDSPAGLGGLLAVVQTTALPVYAIGGITAHNAAPCLKAGAYGLAAISALWDCPDSATAAAALCCAAGQPASAAITPR